MGIYFCVVYSGFLYSSSSLFNAVHIFNRQEKEGLITELRKELRVSDDEHRELLTRVNSDDIIRRIRFEL